MPRLAGLLVAILCGASSFAASTRSWELSSYADFLSGTFRNVALDREGGLSPGPSLDEVHASDQAVVWSLASHPDGTLYYGTGHQGAVFRVLPDGTGAPHWKAPEIEIFALAVGPDGNLYAGSSPNGKVYRIARDGEASEFFDPGEQYIWALAFDRKGRLVVGTGGKGKVFRVSADGAGSVWVETGQRHVMSLAVDSRGRMLAGTDPNGILYRLREDGGSFALYDSDLPEVRSVSVDADGAIFFSVMGGGMDRLLQTIPVAQAAVQATSAVAGVQPAASAAAPQVTTSVSYGQPQVVYSGERSALMRAVDGLVVEKLWSSTEENILGLAVAPGLPSRVLFATDREGRIYQTGADRALNLLTQTGKSQLTVLLQSGGGVLVGSAHGGSLYRLLPGSAPIGEYESAPHDTGGVSQWGRLSWRGTTGEGSAIEISTRSGNTYRPDGSWSDWSEPFSDSAGSKVASPSARFVQWRARLAGAARLDFVRVHYLPQNSAPVVRSVNVVPETAKADASSGAKGSDTTSSYSITVSASGSSTPPQATGGGSRPSSPIRKLAVVWSAEDPDGDELRAELSFRGEGETEWKTIEEDLKGPRFSIESDTLADGRYEFRIRVNDGRANPADRVLTGERTSQPILVDQTPPTVQSLPSTAAGELRFAASDAVSEVLSAEFAVDAGTWVPVLPDDGIPDGPREEFTLRLGDLEPGEHLVVLRVRDRAGNAALAKALVR